MRKRQPLSLPHQDELPRLVALLEGRAVEVGDPRRFTEAGLYHRLSSHAAAAIAAGRLRLDDERAASLRGTASIRALSTRALEAELAAIEPLLARL